MFKWNSDGHLAKQNHFKMSSICRERVWWFCTLKRERTPFGPEIDTLPVITVLGLLHFNTVYSVHKIFSQLNVGQKCRRKNIYPQPMYLGIPSCELLKCPPFTCYIQIKLPWLASTLVNRYCMSSGQLEPSENLHLSEMNQSSRKMSASAQTILY